MRGVVGMSIWNLVIIGIISVASVYLFNDFVAGKKIGSYTIGRA